MCDLCDCAFRSVRGLGIHRRAAHGDEFHAERVAERLATAVKVRARMHDTGLSTYALAYRLRSSVQSLVGMHEANLCRFSA